MSALEPLLAGAKVLVTAQRRSGDLAEALQRRGASVACVPTLGVVSGSDGELLVRTRQLIAEPADVVVITTGVGLRGWIDATYAAGVGDEFLGALRESRIVARGPKARGAIHQAGLTAEWVAASETSAEVARYLCSQPIEGLRIAVQHHGAGDDGLEARLRAAGAEPFGLVVYRWGPAPDPASVSDSVAATAAGGYDAVAFTSAPGAAAWVGAVRKAALLDEVRGLAYARRLTLAVVGSVTAAPLESAGLTPLVPDRARLGALVRALIVELDAAHARVRTRAGELRVWATTATLGGEPLALTNGGLAVLRALAAEPGATRSRTELLDVLPDDSTDPHAAEVAVGRVRDAAGGGRLIRTVVKRGYALDLTEADPVR